MKLFTGRVFSAALAAVAAAPAQAQTVVSEVVVSPPYAAVSDVDGPYVRGPYAAMPPEARVPGYGAAYEGPRLLPPQEVYTVLRAGGYSPLGAPRQRGFFYTVAVINRGGGDGRLVIDARDGRVVRSVPAYRIGSHFDRDVPVAYGPGEPLPPMSEPRGVPRPPADLPRLASRTPSAVPLPKPMPSHPDEPKLLAARPAATLIRPDARPAVTATKPAPAQQSAAIQAKPPEAPPAAAAPVESKPAAPQILPTQEMPKVQGLE